MKTCVVNRFVLSALLAPFGSVSVDQLTAQTFQTFATNVVPLIVAGNTIYGTSSGSGSGAVVALNTDGTGLRTLYAFTPSSDGNSPQGLTLFGNTLYGSCFSGGSSGNGTLFSLNTDGTGFTVLYTFADRNSDGFGPSQLVLSESTLYGTTRGGSGQTFENGVWIGGGTVFAINTDGTGFTTLYSFSPIDPNTNINTDGSYPTGAALALSGSTLYGNTAEGGNRGAGTIFAVNTDGTGFTVLHSFDGTDEGNPGTVGDGPGAGLIVSSNTLYGTTEENGPMFEGTVFAVNLDGTSFKILHSFSPFAGGATWGTNTDGGYPAYTLTLLGNTLYGTTMNGGSSGYGVVFAVKTDGTSFTNIHNFDTLTSSLGALIVSASTVYGAFAVHGASYSVNLFRVALAGVQPQLSITPSGGDVIVTWPTNASSFSLQSSTNLGSTVIWTTNLPAPVVVNGQNTVTNPIVGAQQFYRLAQ